MTLGLRVPRAGLETAINRFAERISRAVHAGLTLWVPTLGAG